MERAGERARDDFLEFVKRTLGPELDAFERRRDGGSVLVEMNQMASYHVAHSMLATGVAAVEGASIVAFRIRRPRGVGEWFTDVLMRLSATSPSNIDEFSAPYHAFADSVVELTASPVDRVRARVFVRRLVRSQPSRSDIERFGVGGIWIGDLAYDKHIQAGNPVVDPGDPALMNILREFASNALCISRFIATSGAKVVISAGLAVKPGIPLRAALARGVPAIPMTFDYAWRLSDNRPIWDKDSLEYPSRFDRLSRTEQKSALSEAAQYLERSIGLGSGEHLSYGLAGAAEFIAPAQTSTPWATEPQPDLVDIPNEFKGSKKVLVAVHAFYDAPHSSGLGLFSDFFDWLEHLREIAQQSDHVWLIKLHPDQRDEFLGVREAVGILFEDVANVVLIPSETNHRTLLSLGVDVVLTIYGTIAFEYPWVGVPAIAAQADSLHSAYGYCHHPDSQVEYSELLLNPDRWKAPDDSREILEFVYCRYLAPWNRSIFKRSPTVDFEDGGDFKTEGFYRLWARTPAAVNEELMTILKGWWESGEYSLNYYAATQHPR